MTKLKDLTGQRFGRLVVKDRSDRSDHVYWNCICDCGNLLTCQGSNLRKGTSNSCGCLRKEKMSAIGKAGKGSRTHGMSETRVYAIWLGMRNRCNLPSVDAYKHYGARGITYCDRWDSFENFYADMGEPPEKGTLERNDNDGNYDPENCRWATQKEQSRNTRKSIYAEMDGIRKTVIEWAEESGINYTTLRKRLRSGIPLKEALDKTDRRSLWRL